MLIHVLSQVNVDGEEHFGKEAMTLSLDVSIIQLNIGVLFQYFKCFLYLNHWLEI